MSYTIRLRKYTQLRVHNQIQVKDFKWTETSRTLTIDQQINLAYYCGGKKILSPPRFQHCGGERPRCPHGSNAYASSLIAAATKNSKLNLSRYSTTTFQFDLLTPKSKAFVFSLPKCLSAGSSLPISRILFMTLYWQCSWWMHAWIHKQARNRISLATLLYGLLWRYNKNWLLNL